MHQVVDGHSTLVMVSRDSIPHLTYRDAERLRDIQKVIQSHYTAGPGLLTPRPFAVDFLLSCSTANRLHVPISPSPGFSIHPAMRVSYWPLRVPVTDWMSLRRHKRKYGGHGCAHSLGIRSLF